jgi:1-acyl-sn-glycerol-3-phosphate acyltransferase
MRAAVAGGMRRGGSGRVPGVRSGLSATYRISRALVRLYLGGLVRIRLENAHLPPGPFVVSMNHRSALDMFLYVAILPRRLKFLAKRELLAYPLLGPILSRWCVPVNRGAYDRRALEACVAALRQGFVLSVFPEGTRRAGLAAGHGGAVLLAARAGVPVVPGAILGAYRPFSQVTVRFGEPLYLPRHLAREERQRATRQLMDTIRGLGAQPRLARPPRSPRSGLPRPGDDG